MPTYFVKKGVNIWVAVDNIDLLENTPTGQNIFHGTVIVINQRNVDGEPVNQCLVIPEKLQPEARLAFEIKYLSELETSSPKGNDRSPESNMPRLNLISKNI